jgi:DNA-binding beta-propeller fold protein YncE
MNNLIISTIKLFLLLGTVSISAQSTEVLTKSWEISGFDTPECVEYSSFDEVLYVSNIGGKNPVEKDSNGFISKIAATGEIINLHWATNLNAPKGMAIEGNVLYVTDIDRLVKIDLKTGATLASYPLKDAIALNDIVVASDGSKVVSDSKALTYYIFKDEHWTKHLSDTSFAFTNGLCSKGEYILSGVGDRIIRFSTTSVQWDNYILNTGGVDGLSKVKDNLYIISDWSGRVHLVSTKHDRKLILNTTGEKINAADFYYHELTKTLFIPTFFTNSVVAYTLNVD